MIIEYADVRKVRSIADNVLDDKRIRPYIEEIQDLYIRPMFGVKLYKQIENNKPAFEELFAGGEYDNDARHFAGLRKAAGLLVYSRLILNQNINVVAFGVVAKTTELSEPTSEGALIRASNQASSTGAEYLKECVEYLQFKGYIKTCKKPKITGKVRVIGK